MKLFTLTISFLLIAIASLNAFDFDGMLSPEPHAGLLGKTSANERLFAAAERGDSYEVTQALESPSVNINGVNNSGATPLIIASRKGHLEVVRNLVQHGADIQAEDKQGVNALFAAIAENQVPVVTFLAGETNINQQDNQGYTPLMRAVLKNNKTLVQTLVEKNADLTIKDYRGDTALAIAKDTKLDDIAEYLDSTNAQKMHDKVTPQNIHALSLQTNPLTAGQVEDLVAGAQGQVDYTDQDKYAMWVLARKFIGSGGLRAIQNVPNVKPETVAQWNRIVREQQQQAQQRKR